MSYLDVVYAQTALPANRRTATQIGGQRMVATVVLIKALGPSGLACRLSQEQIRAQNRPGSISKAAIQQTTAKAVIKREDNLP